MQKLIYNRYVRNKRVARVMDYCPTFTYRQAAYMRDRTELGYQRTRRLKATWYAAPNGAMVQPAWFPWEEIDWGVRIGYRMIALESSRRYHSFAAIDWPYNVYEANIDPENSSSFEDVLKLSNPCSKPKRSGKSFILTKEVHDTLRETIVSFCNDMLEEEEEESNLGS